MEGDALHPDLIKSCNPGMSDFGSGNVISMTSLCLRSAKHPSDCRACIEACPTDAMVADLMQKPHVSTACLRCGLCVAVCPTNALAASMRSVQQIIRLMLQASLRVDRLAITCNRSFALLRLAAESSDPDMARVSLRQLDRAVASENLYVVPCLAMMSREMWFAALNEIGVSDLESLCVLLPPDQCSLCPVNCNGQAPELLTAAIDCAEQWSGQTVGIVESADKVPQRHFLNVREFLISDMETDRRSMFTGFVDELRHSWDQSLRVGNKAPDEARRAQARKQTIQRTLLADDLVTDAGGQDKPQVAALRQALVEAIGRNPRNAGRVEILVSETDPRLCDGCGQCVASCPPRARRKEGDIVETDYLYCLGCSACMQVCPHQAIGFVCISGQSFLRVEGG